MENYEKLKNLIISLGPDIEKIEHKAQAQAAKRVRAKLQDVRDLAKELRQDIQDTLHAAELKKLDI